MFDILVEELNGKAIKDATEYCIDNHDETKLMCSKAYEKLWNEY